jgi:hypothetical protein
MKIPAQLFVTQKAAYGGQPRLGFLNVYEPGKVAFEKKKETQLKWAYDRRDYTHTEIVNVVENGVWVTKGVLLTYPVPYVSGVPPTRTGFTEVIANPPVIWDNVPTVGFKIAKSVSRYSTSNKLWRINDPRGVQFEISTQVFEDLISEVTIIKGEIQEPCIWMGNGKLVAAI